MSRIWAVARHTIAESIRQKIALVGFVLIAIILAVVPVTSEGDGSTLASRVQVFLAYTLGGVGFVLSVITVFLSCNGLAQEITSKSIFMVVTKPLPRWQLFMGKWLGLGVLNALILLIVGGAVLGATEYLKRRPTSVPGDRERLVFEVLNARDNELPDRPEFEPMIEERLRRLREEGRLSNETTVGEPELRQQILEELEKSWRSIAPTQIRVYAFKGLMVDRASQDTWLHLHFKPQHAGGMSDFSFPATMQFGDPDQPDTITPVMEAEYLADRFSTVEIPGYAVNDQGLLYVKIGNRDPQYTVIFEGNDSLELLYNLGTFHWNLFRALCIVWCRLAFLAAVGLLCSSFLSFPVACMGTFLVLAVSSAAGFLGSAVGWVAPVGPTDDPMWLFGPALRALATGFIWLVPDFSKYDAVSNVVSGRLVPLKWVLDSMVVLVLIRAAILAILGCVVLTRRELAQET